MARTTQDFQTIRSEGALLPPDLLRRVVDPKAALPGTKPEDYGLPPGERLNEVITQSWNRLRRHWADFRSAAKSLPAGEPGTGLTNDKWSLPLLRELGFGLLPSTAGPEIDGRSYPISRFYGPTAVHLVGCNLNLDRRAAGVRGAAAANPHGLVQEFLNRSDKHMWAILSNGLQLRILRDNQALSRQSFLEFDLESMLAGEVYSDFVVLWLMAHATRFAPLDGDKPESCWLEQWTKVAEEQGTRALGDLRAGVENALQALGQGLVGHPKNTALRESLRDGRLSLPAFHGELLRVVYRLIFLFVAEDRTLDGVPFLHPHDDSDAGRQARARYSDNYSVARLRELASKIRGSRHGDLWHQFNLLVGALSGDARFDAARRQLALPVLGSFLWSPSSTPNLNAPNLGDHAGSELTNADFLEAIRNLAFTRQGKTLRPVDYKNLGSEELGGIYESLLALTPQISGDGARFTFAEFSGNERKTSGSYYTPDSLVQCLLDSALDPVVADAVKGKAGADAESAILNLRVCDPACGSGHFLVGAAHRLARHLARARAHSQGESEPSPLMYQHALREVIRRCVYGVDLNPMAVELCKVSLWMESMEPGKPLTFLDAHIRCGNSLLGTTPRLMDGGISDDAFDVLTGDAKEVTSYYKKRNKKERTGAIGQRGMFAHLKRDFDNLGNLPAVLANIAAAEQDTVEAVRRAEEQYATAVRDTSYENAHLLADAWCAAFVWRKHESDAPGSVPGFKGGWDAVTEDVYREIEASPHSLAPWMKQEIRRLAGTHRFFHPHLEFPEVFRPPSRQERDAAAKAHAKADEWSGCDSPKHGWNGGFSVILGNPPWERVKLQEQEFFAQRDPVVAGDPNAAARKKTIAALKDTNPGLLKEFEAAMRQAEGESHLMRSSGRYPLCGRGDINTYAVFAESMRDAIGPTGRMGVIVPTGIATDDTTKFFFGDMVETRTLASLLSFENEEFIFPGVHHSYCFSLLIASGLATTQEQMVFVFFARRIEHLSSDAGRRFVLTPEDIVLLNPNTLTCPVFRSERDAEITKAIYRRVPVLIREARDGLPESNLWGLSFLRMFDMSNDSDIFITPEVACPAVRKSRAADVKATPTYLPLYEAKMLHQFDHRWATYAREGNSWLETPIRHKSNKDGLEEPDPRDFTDAERADPTNLAAPRYWLKSRDVEDRLIRPDSDGRVHLGWQRKWLLVFRSIARANNDRSVIVGVIPATGVGNSAIVVLPEAAGAVECACLLACMSAFVFDFACRQKLGGLNLNFFIVNQFPVLPPSAYSARCRWDAETSLADWIAPRVLELVYTAHDLAGFARDLGHDGPPFRWDPARRAQIRAELDAAFFYLYGVSRDEAAYILDTFLIFKVRDEERNGGVYKTKETILAIYDELAEATQAGSLWTSPLNPPPGDPRAAHPR